MRSILVVKQCLQNETRFSKSRQSNNAYYMLIALYSIFYLNKFSSPFKISPVSGLVKSFFTTDKRLKMFVHILDGTPCCKFYCTSKFINKLLLLLFKIVILLLFLFVFFEISFINFKKNGITILTTVVRQ